MSLVIRREDLERGPYLPIGAALKFQPAPVVPPHPAHAPLMQTWNTTVIDETDRQIARAALARHQDNELVDEATWLNQASSEFRLIKD